MNAPLLQASGEGASRAGFAHHARDDSTHRIRKLAVDHLPMKVLVIGAGSIGVLLAAHFAAVDAVARGPQLPAMREAGSRLEPERGRSRPGPCASRTPLMLPDVSAQRSGRRARGTVPLEPRRSTYRVPPALRADRHGETPGGHRGPELRERFAGQALFRERQQLFLLDGDVLHVDVVEPRA